MWRMGEVVADWKSYDNWQGISLLDIVGKIFAQVIQKRLQVIAECVLPDSQSDFRKGRGCA